MKLDLRKTRVTSIDGAGGLGEYNLEEDFGQRLKDALDTRTVVQYVFKFIGFGAAVFIIMQVENYRIDKFTSIRNQAQAKLDQANQTKNQVNTQIQEYSRIQQITDEFNRKLDIVKQLADKRIKAISGLDQLQTIIPERVKLTEVKFQDDNFVLKGKANTTDKVSSFVKALEDTNMFLRVHLDQLNDGRNKKKENH